MRRFAFLFVLVIAFFVSVGAPVAFADEPVNQVEVYQSGGDLAVDIQFHTRNGVRYEILNDGNGNLVQFSRELATTFPWSAAEDTENGYISRTYTMADVDDPNESDPAYRCCCWSTEHGCHLDLEWGDCLGDPGGCSCETVTCDCRTYQNCPAGTKTVRPIAY